jgi:hypothetical protein
MGTSFYDCGANVRKIIELQAWMMQKNLFFMDRKGRKTRKQHGEWIFIFIFAR